MRYTHEQGVVRKIKTGIINGSLSITLMISGMGGALPLLLASHASAAPGLVYGGSFAGLSFIPDREEPSGGYTQTDSSLELRVDNSSANTSSTFYQTEGLQAAIAASRSISASVYLDQDWTTKPVRVGLWGVTGSTPASDLAYPIIEYTNGTSYTGWRVFDTLGSGTWFNLDGVNADPDKNYQLEIAFNAATKNYDYFINDSLVTSKPAADGSTVYGNFQAVVFNNYNSASSDAADDYTVTWKGFRTGQAPSTGACTTTNTIKTTDLANWDRSDTRSAGHNRLLADGLRIWTDTGATGSPDPRKAAGYYPADYALSANGNQTIAQSIDYQATNGITPGLQLVVDFDNNGSDDGILVGEAIYGNNWWLPDSGEQFVKDGAPSHGGGSGSSNNGTIDEWVSSFPDAHVTKIGYSLGSGVNGDGIIKRITLGCTNYTFGLGSPTLLAPADNAVVNGASVTNSWSAVPDAAKYEYRSYNDAAGTSLRFSDTYTATSKTATDVPNGTVYYWRVRALDMNGNAGPWSNNGNLWKVTVDSQAPSAPTNLSWKTSAGNTVANNGSTNLVAGSAQWQSSSADASSFIYRYWNDIPGNQYKVGSEYQTTTGSTSLGGSFNQGEGVHHFTVQAVDAAGNKSAVSPVFTITYDKTAPGVPSATFTEGNSGDTVVSGGFTDIQNFTFTLPAGVDRYQLKYWNDISGSAYNGESNAWNPTNLSGYMTNSTTYKDNFTQGNGKHYFAFSACDSTGNCSTYSAPFEVTFDNVAPTTPVASPSAGTYADGQTVGLSSTDSLSGIDKIYYTTNDSTPSSSNGTVYTAPFTVASSQTVKAIAYDLAGNPSAVLNAEYVITPAPANTGGSAGNGSNGTNGGNTNVTVSSFNNQAASTGDANVSDNTDGGDATTGQVLGEATGTPNSDASSSSTGDSAVKGAATTEKPIQTSNEFFGMGWWWLPILALIGGFLFFVLRRRNADQN